jgi:hypothetical protein
MLVEVKFQHNKSSLQVFCRRVPRLRHFRLQQSNPRPQPRTPDILKPNLLLASEAAADTRRRLLVCAG